VLAVEAQNTNAAGRRSERIQIEPELALAFYNLVTPYNSLKFGKVKSTSAMQAGIRIWDRT
jgi:hypothetical protein